MAAQEFSRGGLLNFLIDLPIRVLFAFFALLPYRISLSFAAWITTRVLAPLFGINKRIKANFDLIWPDLPVEQAKNLALEVADNSTRLMVESFNITGFLRHARRSSLAGEGLEPLLEALKNGQPVILVSGHFGNYQTLRVLLSDLGHDTAAIYRPMNNAFTNTRYINNMNKIAGPNFPRGLAGTKGLLTHLRKGGAIALLNDQQAHEGAELSFMGHPAQTMLSAAEFALKYKAQMFPYYGIRQENRVDFDVIVEPAIAHSDATAMTQTLNDSLEKQVIAHPGQWFWMHKRWKRPYARS
ncbi:MAG: KDO2-lipid IV(A) lauroyltransferase [Paracoccaceae bacterium]|jgi:KDO2-lipid IV(A) lauroyltransferase